MFLDSLAARCARTRLVGTDLRWAGPRCRRLGFGAAFSTRPSEPNSACAHERRRKCSIHTDRLAAARIRGVTLDLVLGRGRGRRTVGVGQRYRSASIIPHRECGPSGRERPALRRSGRYAHRAALEPRTLCPRTAIFTMNASRLQSYRQVDAGRGLELGARTTDGHHQGERALEITTELCLEHVGREGCSSSAIKSPVDRTRPLYRARRRRVAHAR
jgi:hypothetical protein